MTIELKSYNLLGDLDDEQDALESFTTDYEGNVYVCDAITEIADRYIPIHYSDIWENARDIQEHIEEAVAQGILEGVNDLIKIFQAGYYQFYSQSLYNNLDALVYNMITENVNQFLKEHTEIVSLLDIEEVEHEIETVSEDYDNNKKFSDIEDEVARIIQAIKDGEFNLESDPLDKF